MTYGLGIDIGGSGIKGALVDVSTGEMVTERTRIPTPRKSSPKNVVAVVNELVEGFADQLGDGPIGITVPAPVKSGKIMMMANLHKSWVGLDADSFFSDSLGREVHLVNDADAAGLAEVAFGAARGHDGVVVVTTLGTGIGTAIVHDGKLLPNTELGHLEIDGHDAESRASSGFRERKRMSYKRWAKRLEKYYSTVERLLWPDLFVVGGGVSKNHEKFLPLMKLQTPIVAAKLLNQAGIIGASLYATQR